MWMLKGYRKKFLQFSSEKLPIRPANQVLVLLHLALTAQLVRYWFPAKHEGLTGTNFYSKFC